MNLFGEEAVVAGSMSAVQLIATNTAGRPSCNPHGQKARVQGWLRGRCAGLVQAGRNAARHVHDHCGPAGAYVGERDRIPFGRMRGENRYEPPCRWEDQGQKVRRDARPFGPAVPHDARRT